MEKGTIKYLANRLGGHLPERISEPSCTRFSNDTVIYGFNDFMTQCRQPSMTRNTDSSANRIRGDPLEYGFMGTGTCVTVYVKG